MHVDCTFRAVEAYFKFTRPNLAHFIDFFMIGHNQVFEMTLHSHCARNELLAWNVVWFLVQQSTSLFKMAMLGKWSRSLKFVDRVCRRSLNVLLWFNPLKWLWYILYEIIKPWLLSKYSFAIQIKTTPIINNEYVYFNEKICSHLDISLQRPTRSEITRVLVVHFTYVPQRIHLQWNHWDPKQLDRHNLTHWGRVTHICVSKLTIIGSGNGLSPGWRQAIIWINDLIYLIEPLGANFTEILIEIFTFSFRKIHLKMSSWKWRPFCLELNVLSWGRCLLMA